MAPPRRNSWACWWTRWSIPTAWLSDSFSRLGPEAVFYLVDNNADVIARQIVRGHTFKPCNAKGVALDAGIGLHESLELTQVASEGIQRLLDRLWRGEINARLAQEVDTVVR